MTNITELTSKYIVIPRKYLSTIKEPDYNYVSDKLTIQFADIKSLYDYNQSKSEYFVMKLQDNFNISELIKKLMNCYPELDNIPYDIWKYPELIIKGSKLSLLILNSISDKSKLL